MGVEELTLSLMHILAVNRLVMHFLLNDRVGPSLSAKCIMGKTITERKLTFVQQALSGHMVPQYQPSSAYRQLAFLLSRIDSLTSRVPFTTLPQSPQSNATSIGEKRDLAAMGTEFKKWF